MTRGRLILSTVAVMTGLGILASVVSSRRPGCKKLANIY